MIEKTADLKTRLHRALEMREKRAADLVNDLKIPKSAVSQYLSGKSQNMDSGRLFALCRYLNVSEPWLMGYDVPLENSAKKSSTIADAALRMKTDPVFMSIVEKLLPLEGDRINDVDKMLSIFLK